MVLLFANDSDAPVQARLKLDLHAAGLTGDKFRVQIIRPAAADATTQPAETFETPALLDRPLNLPAKTAVAWEGTAR